MTTNRITAVVVAIVLFASSLAAFVVLRRRNFERTATLPNVIQISAEDETVLPVATVDEDFVRELLKPRDLQFNADGTAKYHQLLHLHHMKTGGTSTERLLRCGVRNLANSSVVPFQTIHECSRSLYDKCVRGQDKKCIKKIDESAVMSYCAPLSDLSVFGWDVAETSKVTVLRHPVDRVWSMFRFQTKSCYSCRPLRDVYADIDAGKTQSMRPNCIHQLSNHMTRNMLATSVKTQDLTEQSLNEAIQHLQGFLVGVTSELSDTVDKLKRVFPFLEGCELSHANASPKNNRCGPNATHWDLPAAPDEETRQLILAHNQLDLKLYEAGLEQYELQKRILNEMN